MARHDGEEDFTITTETEMLDVLGRVLSMVSLAVAGIGAISLVVGAIGILTMMWIAVGERTGEIGLMRARRGDAPPGPPALPPRGRHALVGRRRWPASSPVSVSGGLLRVFVPGLPLETKPGYVAAALAVSFAVGVASGVLPGAPRRVARSPRGAPDGVAGRAVYRTASRRARSMSSSARMPARPAPIPRAASARRIPEKWKSSRSPGRARTSEKSRRREPGDPAERAVVPRERSEGGPREGPVREDESEVADDERGEGRAAGRPDRVPEEKPSGVDRQGHGEDDAPAHQGEDEAPGREQRSAGRAGRPPHDVVLGRFGLEGDRADGIDDELEKDDLDGQQQERPAEEHRHERHPRDRHVHGDEVGRGLLEVVEDAPAEPDRLDDRREVVVEEHQGRGLARDVGAAASHRDADVGGLQGRRVVDAVARHDDDLAPRLEGLDEPQLLRRNDAREDGDPADPGGERGVVERVELRPRSSDRRRAGRSRAPPARP